MSKMTSVGSECETVGSERERECDIIVGFESEKVQLALWERERWVGMGLKFESNGLYVYLYILKARKFTVAVNLAL